MISVRAVIQGYTPDEPNSSYAHMLVNISDAIYNVEMIEKIDDFCFNHFPNADIKVAALEGGGGGTPIEIQVAGEDPDELARISERVKLRLSEISGTKNVKDDWGPKSKKFVIDIDQTTWPACTDSLIASLVRSPRMA